MSVPDLDFVQTIGTSLVAGVGVVVGGFLLITGGTRYRGTTTTNKITWKAKFLEWSDLDHLRVDHDTP